MPARRLCGLLLLFLSACVSSPKSVVPLTSINSGYLATEGERKLIGQSEQVHAEFVKRGMVVTDPQLAAYLEKVAARVRPALSDNAPTLHYYILKSAELNAMALPNGNIYINAGLIVRLESEDQLALVLAHETAHVVQRHSYKGSLDRHNTVVAAHVTDLLLGGTGIAYLPFAMDLASFSREQEKDADLCGLKYLAATDYNLEDSTRIFDKLAVVKYADKSTSVWGSHPALMERKQYSLQAIGAPAKASHEPTRAGYEPFRRQLAEEVIRSNILNGRYELALDAVDYEIAQQGDAAIWHVYKGDAKRSAAEHPERAAQEHAWLYDERANDALTAKFQRQASENFVESVAEYEKALQLQKDKPEALRGLGLAAYAQGDRPKARNYLQRYLALADRPTDRRYIESLLNRPE